MSYTARSLSIDEVWNILKGEGYESILDHIEERDCRYHLKGSASSISPLPSYHYALGVTLMALGNKEAAEEACGSLWRYLGSSGCILHFRSLHFENVWQSMRTYLIIVFYYAFLS
jgi:hypothetical protein